MMKWLIKQYRPTPLEAAEEELRLSRLALMEAQRLQEHYKGLSIALKSTVKRLTTLTDNWDNT